MKKYFSAMIIIASLMFAMPSQAQIKFGVKGGVNLSKVSFSGGNMSSQNYTGFFFGPTAEVTIPFLGFGVDGSLLYSQTAIANSLNKYSNVKQKELIVPINLKYTVGSSLAGIFFFGGPQFGLNLDKTGNDGGYHTYKFTSTPVSVNLGIGFKLANHVQISGNYNLPLTKTATYSDNTSGGQNFDCKNKSWQFAAAWFF